VNNVSYNGGVGGVSARPTPAEEAAHRERHFPPSRVQTQHLQTASTNRQLYESVNHGKPPIAATAKPAEFRGHGVVAAKAAARAHMPPTARTAARPGASNTASRPVAPVHPNDRPPTARPSISNTGSPKLDKKYQQDQDRLFARQEQEHQRLQQKQEQEHQRMQARPDEGRRPQLEQRHQQQTQQLEQRHAQDQQKLQDRQQQGNRNPRR
jgi:hypothetical protein